MVRKPLLWGALAVVPVVAMVFEVARAPRLHFLDYWTILSHVTDASGALDVAGLFTLHNQHPTVTPGLLFWLDGHLTGGSNVAVGFVNVVLAAAAVLALRLMLPADLDSTKKGALTVAFSFLLFSSGALEMFGMGMSGASWLLGLVPAVFAMLFAHRGNTVAALVLGVAANLGHGTAFAVWPALALVAWLRGDAWWRVFAPLGTLVALVAGWLVLPSPAGPPYAGGEVGFDTWLAVVAGTLSPLRVADGSPVALAAGGLIAVVLVAFVVVAVRERPARRDVGWVGLGTHMLGAAVMIGFTRLDYGPTIGLTTRYATLSGLATCAVLALVVLCRPTFSPGRVGVGVCAVAVATYAAGSFEAATVRNQYPNQELLAVAMRVGADDVVRADRIDPAHARLAERAGFYPFTDDFELGCGVRLGQRLSRVGTAVGDVDTGPVVGDAELRGWALVDGHRADCVFVVDGAGTVAGGGYTGVARPDVPEEERTSEQRSGWAAVAEPSVEDASIVVSSGGRYYRI